MLGFFTEQEEAGLKLTRMVIHVVGKPGEPFVPQPEIEVQQEEFFRLRIISEAGDAIHKFSVHSRVRPIAEEMGAGTITFEKGGQLLAENFWRDHVKQSTSGAFFVCELEAGLPDRKLYALIKYDYREAVELSHADGKSVLRAIVQAFVKERRAVQKFCVIRVVGGKADELISASDRMHEAPDLTDYFAKYLGVERDRSNDELSLRLAEAIRQSVEDLREFMPNRQTGPALAKAKLALQSKEKVSNEDVVDAIMHAAGFPADEKIRTQIEDRTRRNLRRKRLQDVTFKPDATTLQVRPRQYVKTAEEVRLEFPAEQLGQSVIRSEKDGRIVFTVTTNRLVEDGTLPDRPRPRA